MKTYLYKTIFLVFISSLIFCLQQVYAQTTITTGEVKGIWVKKGSPYLIKGDINIPAGDSLIILPGVKITINGKYKINVQGSLKAVGNIKDSIIFTVADTSGKSKSGFVGWNGIRFDRRPIKWDTIRFNVPENYEFNEVIQEQTEIIKRNTATKIILKLDVNDQVNDTLIPDSLFSISQSSILAYCRLEYGSAFGKAKPDVFGGAIYIYRYSNLTISNCVFENNRAWAGGAIYCKEAAPLIINNLIKRCQTESSGGAMVFIHSGAMVFNNTIVDNTSKHNGGGILFYESNPYVLNNIFLRNSASNQGGGIYFERNYKEFSRNENYEIKTKDKYNKNAFFELVTMKQSMVSNINSLHGRFTNNVICYNKSKNGGGVGLAASAPEFINNTICYNYATEKGGGYHCIFSSPLILNSIVCNNNSADGINQLYFYGKSSKPEIRYCNIQGGLSGIDKDKLCPLELEFANNINLQPQFTNAANNDFTLDKQSPCIDVGMPDISSMFLILTDITGKNRIINNIVDIGAIEFDEPENSKLKNTQDKSNESIEITDQTITNVYPNPSNGCFSVIIRNNRFESIRINIFDQKGGRIYDKTYSSEKWFEEQINLNGYSTGTYIIIIYSDEHILYGSELIIE